MIDGIEQVSLRDDNRLVVRAVQSLSPTRDGRGAPWYRRGVKIGAELGAWAWLIEHAVASPGIVFEALGENWRITAELIDDHLVFRNYRLALKEEA